MKKKVIIIEDDFHLAELMKEHINEMKDFECHLIFSNPVEYLKNPIEAEIFLLDIMMPEMNGLEAIPKILQHFPNTNIIMNTIMDDSETIFQALQFGAVGYIDKQSFEMNFPDVFQCIDNGGAFMTPKIARKIIGFFHQTPEVKEKLTQREADIVQGILDGYNRNINEIKTRLNLTSTANNLVSAAIQGMITAQTSARDQAKIELDNLIKFTVKEPITAADRSAVITIEKSSVDHPTYTITSIPTTADLKYTFDANPDPGTAIATVTGLTNNTSYTFKIVADY
ncbi:MAG: DNA-binding response regulator, partial [Crocinitomicaceae bacterium]|nr:DNA-binding response regulator [Crocinitomicaceae bacterium]